MFKHSFGEILPKLYTLRPDYCEKSNLSNSPLHSEMPMDKLVTNKLYRLDQNLLWSNPNISESKSFYQKRKNKYTNNPKLRTFLNKNMKTKTLSYRYKTVFLKKVMFIKTRFKKSLQELQNCSKKTPMHNDRINILIFLKEMSRPQELPY